MPTLVIVNAAGVAVDAAAAANDTVAASAAVANPVAASAAVANPVAASAAVTNPIAANAAVGNPVKANVAAAVNPSRPPRLQRHAVTVGDCIQRSGGSPVVRISAACRQERMRALLGQYAVRGGRGVDVRRGLARTQTSGRTSRTPTRESDETGHRSRHSARTVLIGRDGRLRPVLCKLVGEEIQQDAVCAGDRAGEG